MTNKKFSVTYYQIARKFSDPWSSKNLNNDNKCQKIETNVKTCQKNAKIRYAKILQVTLLHLGIAKPPIFYS